MTNLVDLIYFRENGACLDPEKEACFETVRQVFRLWSEIRKQGILITDVLADKEPDPFFRACLRDFADVRGQTEEHAEMLRQLYARYIVEGRYRGAELLRALVIAEGLSMLAVCCQEYYLTWGDRLSWVLRGWFGVEFRDRLAEVLDEEVRLEERKRRSKTSAVPEFDQFATLESAPERRTLLRDYIRDGVSSRTLGLALKGAAVAVEDFFLEDLDPERRAECRLVRDCPARQMDVEAAQREMLERAGTWEKEP